MKTKILRILYDMRNQPVIAWVTIIGTALSIFLIMTVVMMQQVSILPYAPESNRDRMLYGCNMHTTDVNGNGDNSSRLSLKSARYLYEDLDGVEAVSYVEHGYTPVDAKGITDKTLTVHFRTTDDIFWKIFDFDLLAGRYYNADEVDAKRNLAVVTESVARELFGDENPVGQHFELDHNDYELIGVVADVSILASQAYGQVFGPLKDRTWGDDGYFGNVMAAMLVDEGVDFEHVREQVKGRYAAMDGELEADGKKTVYHNAPYDQETVATGLDGSNSTPNPGRARTVRLVIYIILLIVPAINLSSMLHSRLRRRVNEIGIQRAFGCTRKRIISDIISESLIVTLIGGLIGLIFAIVFALFYDGLYDPGARPALSMLVSPQIFVYAFGACFILNILSAAAPAWQASRLNPVEAINAK